MVWTGNSCWLWAWGIVTAFQLVLMVLAPILILPLFNKFTPLPPGDLRDRLLSLCRQTGFPAQSIEVMDGSKRSQHSNAFFTGFGRFRKVVLYDTLVAQLGERQLQAVLAHEIGHYRQRHVLKMLLLSIVVLGAAFYLLSLLTAQHWFYEAFGFVPGNMAAAFCLFALLAPISTYWLAPLQSALSRRWEYAADAFASRAVGETGALVAALRKLHEKNLGNLTPHPLYSRFYCSHPTLQERESTLSRSCL